MQVGFSKHAISHTKPKCWQLSGLKLWVKWSYGSMVHHSWMLDITLDYFKPELKKEANSVMLIHAVQFVCSKI